MGCQGLRLCSNIIFLTQFPLTLLFERDDFDLTQGCLIGCLFWFDQCYQSPVRQEGCDCVPSFKVTRLEVLLLTVKKKQLFEVNNHVPTLLVQDVA